MSNIYAPQQLGESEEQFAARLAAAQRQDAFRGQGGRPISTVESISTIPVVDSHGEELEEESAPQVKQEPVEKTPLMSRVALAEKFTEQVAYQCMRNQDLKRQGYSLIDDQGITFEGIRPVDEMRQQFVQRTAQASQDGGRESGRDDLPYWADTRRARFSGQQPVRVFLVVPPARGRNKTPGLMEATKVYNENMHQRLSSIIDDAVGVALRLPEGIKPRKAESKHIQPYQGESKFSDLENWTMDVCNHLVACQYGGDQLDRERVFVLPEFLEGSAKNWFRHHVLHYNRARQQWTFKDVILELYNRFVSASTMQDASKAFIMTAYNDKLGVQGFYDTLIDHAQNMSIYPDNWVMIDTFLRGILDAMRESLICNDGLSPEVNTIEEFVVHALRYEQSHRIAKHFELHCSKTRIVTRAEPQKVGTFWACRKELAGNASPRVVLRPAQSQERRSWNDLHVDVVEQPVVALYQRPPPEDAGQQRPADVLKQSNVPWKFEASRPIGASACFRCGQSGHYAKDCPGNNDRQGNKPQAYIHAVQTAIPDDDIFNSGNKPDVKDDEVDNLLGNVPGDNTASETGEHPDEFIKVDVYDNDYYAWESDTEFMGALTDYLASELNRPIGAGNVKVYKVHLCKAPGKLVRPVVRCEDKECLASYVEVNGHKAWTLWDSRSMTTGVMPQFCQVHGIYVSELKEPLLLQLGTVGSRAAVQFGTQANVACAGVTTQEYLDVANFDCYDMIIGTLYMRKHRVILDFEKNKIVVGGQACPAI
ncbi:hypothetical protein C0992_001225 [Termitomyces sp. T32_za158]|nr:hypothetical protein C0992_001225 [Termitomyces sp. T32_za158]